MLGCQAWATLCNYRGYAGGFSTYLSDGATRMKPKMFNTEQVKMEKRENPLWVSHGLVEYLIEI